LFPSSLSCAEEEEDVNPSAEIRKDDFNENQDAFNSESFEKKKDFGVLGVHKIELSLCNGERRINVK